MSRVRADIIQSLKLQNAFTAVSSFDRPNIFYGVKGLNRTAAFREELAREILKDVGKSGSTIIYCTTVNDVDEVINLKLGGKNCVAMETLPSGVLSTDVLDLFMFQNRNFQ